MMLFAVASASTYILHTAGSNDSPVKICRYYACQALWGQQWMDDASQLFIHSANAGLFSPYLHIVQGFSSDVEGYGYFWERFAATGVELFPTD